MIKYRVYLFPLYPKSIAFEGGRFFTESAHERAENSTAVNVVTKTEAGLSQQQEIMYNDPVA